MTNTTSAFDPDRLAAPSREARRGRPHVLLVVGSSEPRPHALLAAAWLGRRLRAEVLVTSPVEYRPPRDDLLGARVASAREVVAATAARLAGQGVDAGARVVIAHDGAGAAAIDDLADQHEADLVAITSRRRSWFWIFPGSLLAHRLTRLGHRPVLVIPDHQPALHVRLRAWLDERHRAGARPGTAADR